MRIGKGVGLAAGLMALTLGLSGSLRAAGAEIDAANRAIVDDFRRIIVLLADTPATDADPDRAPMVARRSSNSCSCSRTRRRHRRRATS